MRPSLAIKFDEDIHGEPLHSMVRSSGTNTQKDLMDIVKSPKEKIEALQSSINFEGKLPKIEPYFIIQESLQTKE